MFMARNGSSPPSSPCVPGMKGENKINRICMSYSVPAGLLLTRNYIIRHMAPKFNGTNWLLGRCILVTIVFPITAIYKFLLVIMIIGFFYNQFIIRVFEIVKRN